MGQLEGIRLIYSITPEDHLIVGNMNMNTWCMQAVVKGKEPKNLLFGIDMGFCTATALGLALALPHRRVISLDGDGGVLMKLATLAQVGEENPANLVIVVMDNESYGGNPIEPTATATVANLASIAKASGIKNTTTVHTLDELRDTYQTALSQRELWFIVAKVHLPEDERRQIFDDRYRVDVEWKSAFIRNIEKAEGIRIMRFGGLYASSGDKP